MFARCRFSVTVRQVCVNGKKRQFFNGFEKLHEALSSAFADQGEFYEKVFGVSRSDASAAGWDPDGKLFSTESWNVGFHKFLKDGGLIEKSEVSNDVDIVDLLWQNGLGE